MMLKINKQDGCYSLCFFFRTVQDVKSSSHSHLELGLMIIRPTRIELEKF